MSGTGYGTEVADMERAVTINFPAPLPAEIPCPICQKEEKKKGMGCRVCKWKGSIQVTVDAKVPIQRSLIVKYVAENMGKIGTLLTKQYGLSPEISTEEVIQVEDGEYEIVKVSSLGGVVWVVNRLDKLASPRYFRSFKELNNFRSGWYEE
tara:strand:- start:1076 stop:1528 length:453 start_codon:yes stop_codon:yes gene_type:complete